MSILSSLVSNKADDIARIAANKGDDALRALARADYDTLIKNAQKQIDDIGAVSLFAKDADSIAKRAKLSELRDSIKAYEHGFDNIMDYNNSVAAKAASKTPYKSPTAAYSPSIGEMALDTPVESGKTRLFRGLENDFDPSYVPQVSDNGFGYESWTDNYDLAKQYGDNIYAIDVPNEAIANDFITSGGDRNPLVRTDKNAGLNGVSGAEYLLNVNDPLRQSLTYSRVNNGGTLGNLLSPEQESFFKNSVLRDTDNNLIPVYHSTPNAFDTFDDALLGQNTGYENTGFGHFVTPDRDFSARFADINETGTPGRTMELYADIRNPITHPYMAGKKYSGKELDDIVENYIRLTGGEESLGALREYAEENGTSLYDEYMDALMAESPFEFVADERKALQDAGYDAVEFVEGLKNELVDNSDSLEPVSSYAVFGGNQLKDIGNKNPTKNPNIFLGLGGILGGGSILGALLSGDNGNNQRRA